MLSEHKVYGNSLFDSVPVEIRCKILWMAEDSIPNIRLVRRSWRRFVTEWAQYTPLPPHRRLRLEDDANGFVSVTLDIHEKDVHRFEDLRSFLLYQRIRWRHYKEPLLERWLLHPRGHDNEHITLRFDLSLDSIHTFLQLGFSLSQNIDKLKLTVLELRGNRPLLRALTSALEYAREIKHIKFRVEVLDDEMGSMITTLVKNCRAHNISIQVGCNTMTNPRLFLFDIADIAKDIEITQEKVLRYDSEDNVLFGLRYVDWIELIYLIFKRGVASVKILNIHHCHLRGEEVAELTGVTLYHFISSKFLFFSLLSNG
ncbi:hypothetical protein PFISCL1PPCAC_11159 [Pristionchus fissidentatus]|uniref:F-box domain-containing protein n=1 Tax=Pristionchus fissidentatus TaxID=1538716 RepID=A0AAV5VMC2_9BILA|nr:hypothetical protein PFISCL1PPCAC_11159 [Pristionchus fissidentatus]